MNRFLVHHPIRSVIAGSTVTLLVACTAAPAPLLPGPRDLVADGITVHLQVQPDPMLSTANTAVEITVKDASGEMVSDGVISFSLTADAMAMGAIRAIGQAQGAGRYTATLGPTGHAGSHTLTVNVQRQQKSTKFSFERLPVR